jgi:hypothetical protein
MVIKYWKIGIVGILTAAVNTLSICMVLKLKTKIKKIIKYTENQHELLLSVLEQHTKYIDKFTENHRIQLDHIGKIYIILDVIKINLPYAIQKTTSKIASTKELTSSRDANLILLTYLNEEYSLMRVELDKQVKRSENDIEKDKIKFIISEIDALTTVLQTISKESSDEYIDQLFKEVVTTMNKIKSI